MPEEFLMIGTKVLGTFVANEFSLVDLQGMDPQGSFSSKSPWTLVAYPSRCRASIVSCQMGSHFNQIPIIENQRLDMGRTWVGHRSDIGRTWVGHRSDIGRT